MYRKSLAGKVEIVIKLNKYCKNQSNVSRNIFYVMLCTKFSVYFVLHPLTFVFVVVPGKHRWVSEKADPS